jgi:hypothetical protein
VPNKKIKGDAKKRRALLYQDYLKSMVGVQHDKTLKINTHKGLPCGNEGFIRKLSDKVGRDLSFKKRGRPKKG